MKVTIAIDNCMPINAHQPFLAEHGLSMFLDTGRSRLLLDTGRSAAILNNLGLLDIDPRTLDAIILSHGHYDHTGGLAHLLEHRTTATPVYLHEHAFLPHYSVSSSQRHYVGIPHQRELLTTLGADWRPVAQPIELESGLWISGSVPRITAFETGDPHLVIPGRTQDVIDPIGDDMALFVRTPDGLVVVSGCTHSGLINMVRHGLAVTGCNRLRGWIGGTHLGPLSRSQQDQTITELQALDPEFVAANHCTGFAMMARLHETFGARFIPAFVGTTVEF